jgi:hypothetical protein
MRCTSSAAYGITTGDYTQNVCPEHALMTINQMAPPGQKVMVYQIQSDTRCQSTAPGFMDR